MSEPAEVWELIRRSDDLVKYAPNRDRAAAFAQAREMLDRAAELSKALTDASQRARFEEMIALRRGDLGRYDAPDVPTEH